MRYKIAAILVLLQLAFFAAWAGHAAPMFGACDGNMAAPYPPVVGTISFLALFAYSSYVLRLRVSWFRMAFIAAIAIPYFVLLVTNDFQSVGHLLFSIGFGFLAASMWSLMLLVVFVATPLLAHSPIGYITGIRDYLLSSDLENYETTVEARLWRQREKQAIEREIANFAAEYLHIGSVRE